MSDSGPVLRTEELTKRYGAITAVDHVSIDISPGEVYGFIGLNGAGKTTLIRMVTGLASPDGGTVTLMGASDPAGLSAARGQTGCMVESPTFYQHMSAQANLKIQCMLTGADADRRIPEVLEAVGLDNTGNRKVKYFSLGMRQRLGLARALVNRPRLLILDEPVNGLDPAGIYAFREYIHTCVREEGLAVLISSHILSELSQIATRYGIIHKGKLIEEIRGNNLNGIRKRTALIRTTDAARAEQVLRDSGLTGPDDLNREEDGTLRVTGAGERTGELCRHIVESGIDVTMLSTTEYTLEDYFMHLTSGQGSELTGGQADG